MNRRHAIILAIASTGLGACMPTMDAKSAEAAVSAFHDAFNKGSFVQMYLESSEELQRSTPQKDFVEFLSALHRKLGPVKNAESQGLKINMRPSGTTVELTYKTTFDKGEATESFVFHVQDEKAKLFYYNVNLPLSVAN
jgi:hypothetical protein